jgi:hypothetical protein
MRMDIGHWILPANEPQDIPVNAIGFVYCITRISDGKKYIGKKLLENKKKRKPLKGRVNARRYKVESDWREYCGSSPQLNADILKLGKENFRFDILAFYPSKLLLNYHEAKEIVDRNAIFSNEYYNEVLNVRLRGRK